MTAMTEQGSLLLINPTPCNEGAGNLPKIGDREHQCPDLAHYATTLTCMMPETKFKWEPRATHWYERLDALKLAHRKGIKTWVSIEPIIVPWESRYLIAQSLGYVDLYRIGIMNHTNPGFPKADLYEFIKSVKFILEWYQKPHLFKKDIQPYLQEIEKECKEFEEISNVNT